MHKRNLFKATLLALGGVAIATAAAAQDFPPKKPVTLVVGFAAGGAADAAARLIARKLEANIGQTVIVDNKAGAGGNIAHLFTAKGPADGSLLLFGSIGPLTIAPHLMKVGYDPFKDLAPISGGVNFPNVLVVHNGVGAKSLADLVALAKKPGAKVEFASTGAGSASHLAGELFNQRAGVPPRSMERRDRQGTGGRRGQGLPRPPRVDAPAHDSRGPGNLHAQGVGPVEGDHQRAQGHRELRAGQDERRPPRSSGLFARQIQFFPADLLGAIRRPVPVAVDVQACPERGQRSDRDPAAVAGPELHHAFARLGAERAAKRGRGAQCDGAEARVQDAHHLERIATALAGLAIGEVGQ